MMKTRTVVLLVALVAIALVYLPIYAGDSLLDSPLDSPLPTPEPTNTPPSFLYSPLDSPRPTPTAPSPGDVSISQVTAVTDVRLTTGRDDTGLIVLAVAGCALALVTLRVWRKEEE